MRQYSPDPNYAKRSIAAVPSRKQRTLVDETGKRFGIMVVLSRATNDSMGNARWLCHCDTCTSNHIMVGTQLRRYPPKRCPTSVKPRRSRY